MPGKRILIIDDEAGIRGVLIGLFDDLGYGVNEAGDGKSGLIMAMEQDIDLVLLDLSLPGMNGLDVLRLIKDNKPDLPIIMMTGYASLKSALEAMRLGAYDYITKPFDINEVRLIAERALEQRRLIDENRYLKSQLQAKYGFNNVIGSNLTTQRAYVMAAKVAHSNASILVLGETGTGKEYIARAIHYQSPRTNGPFIKVSCAALSETLLESELFGHEKGSFTNAIAKRIGRFEMADGGTLFLDEIGDIPLSVQLKLLRVLQEKEFERVGGNETIKVDVRIVAATNRNLEKAIADKEFREDLYYRLNVVTIKLPPLRKRTEDISELAYHFMRIICNDMNKHIEEISSDAMDILKSYKWSGNLRELSNCIERAIILCNGRKILPNHLGIIVEAQNAPSHIDPPSHENSKSLAEIEKEHILHVLSLCDNNQTHAASILGIDRKTLRNKINQYQIGTDIATVKHME